MTKNEITGDNLKTKPASTLYREGWDAIFGKAKEPVRQGWVEVEDEAAEIFNTAKRGEDGL